MAGICLEDDVVVKPNGKIVGILKADPFRPKTVTIGVKDIIIEGDHVVDPDGDRIPRPDDPRVRSVSPNQCFIGTKKIILDGDEVSLEEGTPPLVTNFTAFAKASNSVVTIG